MHSITLIGTKALVFQLEDAKELREHHIVGTLRGTLPLAPQQSNLLGLPIELSPYEVGYLASSCDNQDDSLQLWHVLDRMRDDDSEIAVDTLKLAAFCHLIRSGYWLLPGLRFGGDFLAYPGDPLKYHSHHIVSTKGYDEDILLDVVNRGRLSTGVKKTWLVISSPGVSATDKPEDSVEMPVCTFSVEWAGF